MQLKDIKNLESINSKSHLQKYNILILSNTGNDGILMNKKRTLEVEMEVDDFMPIKLDKEIILPISQLDKLYPGQIVSPKGTIKNQSSTKKVCIKDETADKDDLMVVDTTGSIKVTPWGDKYKEDLVIRNTYIFKGFRFKSGKF